MTNFAAVETIIVGKTPIMMFPLSDNGIAVSIGDGMVRLDEAYAMAFIHDIELAYELANDAVNYRKEFYTIAESDDEGLSFSTNSAGGIEIAVGPWMEAEIVSMVEQELVAFIALIKKLTNQ